MNFKPIYRKSKETIKSIKTAMKLDFGHCHYKTLSGLPSFSLFRQALWCCVDTIVIHRAPWASQRRERSKVLNSIPTSQGSLGLLSVASRSLLLALGHPETANSLQLCDKPLCRGRPSSSTVCDSCYLTQFLSKSLLY